MRSRTEGTDHGLRSAEPGFGISTRRAGNGRTRCRIGDDRKTSERLSNDRCGGAPARGWLRRNPVVLKELRETYPETQLKTEGLRIFTTLDTIAPERV